MEEQNYYKIRISPEDLSLDIRSITYSGISFGAYTAMSWLLSAGTAGSSLLTDLSIPLLLNQNTIDIGYYSNFDGYVLQKDVINNFIFSSDTTSANTYFVFNTSDYLQKKFTGQFTYYVDWGDGLVTQLNNTHFAPGFISHTYGASDDYVISLSAKTPWGIIVCAKTVTVPFQLATPASNQLGNVNFPNNNGTWSATPSSYNFIFSGDESCDTQTIIPSGIYPIIITGYTKSNLYDMKKVGGGYQTIGVPFTGDTGIVGEYLGTGLQGEQIYKINDILYTDYPDDTTIFRIEVSGTTLLDCQYITKEEIYMNLIEQPQVYSNVFIDRGKNTATEYMNRIGEVDNMGDLIKYGYGYFKIQEY